MTGRNKLLGVTLALLITAQFCFGVFSVVWIGLHPCRSLDHLFVRVRTHRFLVQPIPEINLDVFKLCVIKKWRLGQLVYYNATIIFGAVFTIQPATLLHPGVLTRLIIQTPHIAGSQIFLHS